MQCESYEKPVVEIVDAEELVESVGAQAATTVSGYTFPQIG
jgi:hypothetical protein